LIGRLTRDPEAKYTPSGVPVTSFSIAVDRPQSSEARQQGREKETDFIDIVAWRQTAEFAANYLQKGRMVVVEGKLQIRSYVTQDGQQRKAAEVVADNVRALDRAREGGEGEGAESGGGGYGASRPAASGGYGNSGGNSGGGYGGGGGNAPASRPPAAGANRPASRPPAPASTGDSYDDMDDLADPFAE
jgi:single-strand DNA-binding protein